MKKEKIIRMDHGGFIRGIAAGFHIVFDNKYDISVQFAPGNYCAVHDEDYETSTKQFYWSSPDAEVAILYNHELCTEEVLKEMGVNWKNYDYTDSVIPNCTPEQVAEIITFISKIGKKPEICHCYREREELEHRSEFQKGMYFAKYGVMPEDDYYVTKSICIGAGPEEEPCHCGGNKAQCDFYWPNGKSKLGYNEDGSKKYE